MALFVYAASAALFDVAVGRWAHGSFAGANAMALFYAIHRFVGWRHLLGDVTGGRGTRVEGAGPTAC